MKKRTLQLTPVLLPCVALNVAAGAALPVEMLVFPWGVSDTNQGKFIVNETTLKHLSANQAKMKYERIAIDFQHNTAPVYDPVTKKEVNPEILYGTPRQVAGFASLEVRTPNADANEPGGIYATGLEWLPSQEDAVRGGAYPDMSPTPLVNEGREVIFLHSVALCRQGEVDGLMFPRPFQLSAGAALEGGAVSDFDSTNQESTNNEPLMKPKYLAMLAALGATDIPADATDDALEKMVLAKQTELTKLAATPPASTSATPPAAADVNGVAAQLNKLQADLEQTRRDEILRAAAAQGKAVTLDRVMLATLSATTLQAMVDMLPAGTVPGGSVQGTGTGAAASGGGTGTVTLSAEIRRNLGLEDMPDAKLSELAAKYMPGGVELAGMASA